MHGCRGVRGHPFSEAALCLAPAEGLQEQVRIVALHAALVAATGLKPPDAAVEQGLEVPQARTGAGMVKP